MDHLLEQEMISLYIIFIINGAMMNRYNFKQLKTIQNVSKTWCISSIKNGSWWNIKRMVFNLTLRPETKILPVTMWLQRQGKKPWVLPDQSHSWCCHLLLLMDVTLLVFFAKYGQNWYLILKEKKIRKSVSICDIPLVYQNLC